MSYLSNSFRQSSKLPPVIWLPEDASVLPFSVGSMEASLSIEGAMMPECTTVGARLKGWAYQQLVKLYAPVYVPNILPNVLVMDADVVWTQPVAFLDKLPRVRYSRVLSHQLSPFLDSAMDLARYDEFLEEFWLDEWENPVLIDKEGQRNPGAMLATGATMRLRKEFPRAETAVVHHMLLQREVVRCDAI
eukprot:Filipodium_phascolosomae@DN7874_c0_g1_i1.p1